MRASPPTFTANLYAFDAMLVFTAITSGMWQDIMAEYTFMIKYNQQTRMEHGSLITLYSTDHLTEQNVFMILKVDRKNFIISRIKVASLSLVCTKGSIGLLNLRECCLSWSPSRTFLCITSRAQRHQFFGSQLAPGIFC